ncbi:Flp pilus assembly protein CpaB [Sphingomonas sp.]|uniref:Flp pilus assembly protein CpaB n=1 Tax=Sphingomonas sp. TaxID=28214 RepID=UPI0025CE5743|nr:Flp pilus assembly protein CpaB [Sphingomonas sp.]
MEPKKIALLVGALLIAAITAVMAKNMFGRGTAPVAQAVTVVSTGPEVLVATRALPIGTIIEPDSFRFQPWPKDLIQNAYYLKGTADANSLTGTVVRAQISAGQPLTQGSTVRPGDRGFLAAALGPGMRAVTVSVSASAGVAGFVFPGDRVDLVLTQTVDGGSGSGSGGPPLRASETFVRNIRVLATDQRTVPEDDKGKKEVKTFATVTLEVTPRIGEKIQVAQSIGQVSLSLRSIADNTSDLDAAIASGAVRVPAGTDPKDKRFLVEIASRPIDTNSTYVTGADVSRFQRKTVPTQAPSLPSPAPTTSSGSNFDKPVGPVVHVARGNTVTDAPVGGN